MIELNNKKLHTAILVRLNQLEMTQREFAKRLNISRAIIHRIYHYKNIDTESLFKIIYWLDEDLTDFMLIKPKSICKIYEKINYRNYIKNREKLF